MISLYTVHWIERSMLLSPACCRWVPSSLRCFAPGPAVGPGRAGLPARGVQIDHELWLGFWSLYIFVMFF